MPIDVDQTVIDFQRAWDETFHATLGMNDALKYLIEYDFDTCMKTLQKLARSDQVVRYPDRLFPIVVEKERAGEEAKTKGKTKTLNEEAEETMTFLWSRIAEHPGSNREPALSREQLAQRKQAMKQGKPFDRPENARMYPNRAEHEKNKREWMRYWTEQFSLAEDYDSREEVRKRMVETAISQTPAAAGTLRTIERLAAHQPDMMQIEDSRDPNIEDEIPF